MGAGASSGESADGTSLDAKQALLDIEHIGFQGSFAKIDSDGSGEIDKTEFGQACKDLGVHTDEAKIDELFKRFDEDNSGTISSKEFLQFVSEMVQQESLDIETPDDTSTILPLLGPQEAGNGYKRAIAVLGVNPDAAKVETATGYLPLHILLMQSPSADGTSNRAAAAAAAAAAQAAKPLIKSLLKCHKEGAQKRIMVGLQFPLGHLPLFLALQRGWDAEVCKMIIGAYPEALEICDPLKEEKKPPKAINIKKVRFARKIAEEAGAAEDVLLLLPKPTKKKKEIVWVPGAECAASEEPAKKK